MIYEYKALGEMIMLGENQSTHRKNLSQCHFVH